MKIILILKIILNIEGKDQEKYQFKISTKKYNKNNN